MDTRRLIPLVIFVLSLTMLWSAWQKQTLSSQSQPAARNEAPIPSPNPSPALPQATGADSAGVPRPTAPINAQNTANTAPAIPVASPSNDPIITVRTDLYEADVSVHGGDLLRLELSKFREHSKENPHTPFVLLETKRHYAAQAGLIGEGLPNHNTLLTPVLENPAFSGEGNASPRLLTPKFEGGDSFQLRLEAPEVNGIKATKVYTFKKSSYLIDVAWEIENNSGKSIAPYAYFQLLRDGSAPVGDSFMLSTFYGAAVYTDAGKYQKIPYKEVTEGKAKFAPEANDGWLAMVQHYFVTAWVIPNGIHREFNIRELEKGLYAASVIIPAQEIAPGGKGRVEAPLFAGPQEQATLKKIAPGLDLVVDYGWLHIIAAPIFWLLETINSLVGNWGWSIVVLTIIIKLLFFPLSAASYKSMAKMRQLSPKLMQLKERYADDKQRLNQEMMKLYQTEKINPLGSCLPILVQIPVFIALYWVLLGAVEMRDAPWIFWIKDLTSADPYYVLPAIMMASMFIQTRLNPTPPDPIQAKMMLIMPLVFGVMFFFFPSGLVLYWVVNNILSIAQQWQITRLIESGGKKPKAANDPKA